MLVFIITLKNCFHNRPSSHETKVVLNLCNIEILVHLLGRFSHGYFRLTSCNTWSALFICLLKHFYASILRIREKKRNQSDSWPTHLSPHQMMLELSVIAMSTQKIHTSNNLTNGIFDRFAWLNQKHGQVQRRPAIIKAKLVWVWPDLAYYICCQRCRQWREDTRTRAPQPSLAEIRKCSGIYWKRYCSGI